MTENFNDKLKDGENDNQICELIRYDIITEFAALVTRNDISIKSKL